MFMFGAQPGVLSIPLAGHAHRMIGSLQLHLQQGMRVLGACGVTVLQRARDVRDVADVADAGAPAPPSADLEWSRDDLYKYYVQFDPGDAVRDLWKQQDPLSLIHPLCFRPHKVIVSPGEDLLLRAFELTMSGVVAPAAEPARAATFRALPALVRCLDDAGDWQCEAPVHVWDDADAPPDDAEPLRVLELHARAAEIRSGGLNRFLINHTFDTRSSRASQLGILQRYSETASVDESKKLTPVQLASHHSLSGGNYCVPYIENEALLRLFSYSLARGERCYTLIEKRGIGNNNTFRLHVDLDFMQPMCMPLRSLDVFKVVHVMQRSLQTLYHAHPSVDHLVRAYVLAADELVKPAAPHSAARPALGPAEEAARDPDANLMYVTSSDGARARARDFDADAAELAPRADAQDEERMLRWLQEQESSRVKYGLHVIFPFLCVDTERALLIRQLWVDDLMRLCGGGRGAGANSWEEVVDAAVMAQCGLRMPYTDKVDRCPDRCEKNPSCLRCRGSDWVLQGRPYVPLYVFSAPRGDAIVRFPTPCLGFAVGGDATEAEALESMRAHRVLSEEAACKRSHYYTLKMCTTRAPHRCPVTPGFDAVRAPLVAKKKARKRCADERKLAQTPAMDVVQVQAVQAFFSALPEEWMRREWGALTVRSVSALSRTCVSDRAGLQGRLVRIMVSGTGSKFCCNVNRSHTSNNIAFVISEMRQCAQICFSGKEQVDPTGVQTGGSYGDSRSRACAINGSKVYHNYVSGLFTVPEHVRDALFPAQAMTAEDVLALARGAGARRMAMVAPIGGCEMARLERAAGESAEAGLALHIAQSALLSRARPVQMGAPMVAIDDDVLALMYT